VGADVLSTLRIAIAIVMALVAAVFFSPGVSALMLLAFVIGIATDIVGGMLARRHETARGRVLDSLADKALAYAVLLPLALGGFPPPFLLLPLVARDAVAVALLLLAGRQGTVLPVGQMGRLKTALVYLSCAAFLTLSWLQSGSGPVTVDPGDLGTILSFLALSQLALVVGMLLSFVTLYRYIVTLRSRQPA
jgi:phosphatidylglycerophosphate synthase